MKQLVTEIPTCKQCDRPATRPRGYCYGHYRPKQPRIHDAPWRTCDLCDRPFDDHDGEEFIFGCRTS